MTRKPEQETTRMETATPAVASGNSDKYAKTERGDQPSGFSQNCIGCSVLVD
jgi:hypothetical protein